MPEDWQTRFSPYGQRAGGAETRAFLRLVGKPGLISFAGGIPDPSLFPTQLIAEAHARIFADPAQASAALQYSMSEGWPPLREWIAGYMRGKGVPCEIDNILITSGSQQGLYLCGRLLVGEGEGVLTERPTYLGLLHALAGCNPNYAPLGALAGTAPVDAKLAYVMPDFANPTGESLGLAARHALLEGADAYDVVLLEDAAYTELRYAGAPLPSLLALDIHRRGGIEQSRVLQCGTFSKTIIPGLRTGWVIAASSVIQKMGLLRQAIDFHNSPLIQMVLTDVAARLPQSHIAMLCETYGARCKAMLAALAQHMPAGVTWTKPEGGMFVWMTLPAHVDTAQLLERAIAMGVAFVPGAAFFADSPERNHLRLNFTMCDPATIDEGIARLAKLISEKL
ncbi:MAG TPA: PLP-dependent aminotransferase family protein [Micropepsaceae bacterium]|nr:PLP-dependent aminotransferase family protein [Micropepsaceae bacterium]